MITRNLSNFLQSKMRLPIKSFWWLTMIYSIYFVVSVVYDIYVLESASDDVQTLRTSNDIIEVINLWDEVGEHLEEEPYMWEKYLRAGIVEVGLRHLRQVNKRSENIDEAMIGEIVYNITRTLNHLCELESVALAVVGHGGAEIVADLTRKGTPCLQLWATLLSHKSTQEILIERPEFVDKLVALLHSDHPNSIMGACLAFSAFFRHGSRGKIFEDERIVKWMTSMRENNIEGGKVNPSNLHAVLYTLLREPQNLQEDLKFDFSGDTLFQNRKEIRHITSQVVITAALGALYCGVRWKKALPNLQSSLLFKKMGIAFVGLTSLHLVEPVVDYYLFWGPKAKHDFNRSIADKEHHSFIPEQLLLINVGATAVGNFIFFVSWYNSKFVVLPAVLMYMLNMVSVTEYFQDGTTVELEDVEDLDEDLKEDSS